jgi:hypothetical protein
LIIDQTRLILTASLVVELYEEISKVFIVGWVSTYAMVVVVVVVLQQSTPLAQFRHNFCNIIRTRRIFV